MDNVKKPKSKKTIKAVKVTIPGQKSAVDTTNWDDKSFGTPQGRDLIPVMAEKVKDPNYVPDHRPPNRI